MSQPISLHAPVCHSYFIYDDDVECDSDKKVLASLEEQLNRVDTIYKKKIHESLQNLYQRTARRKHVRTQHAKWKTEIEELWSTLKGDEAINSTQYRFIPRLKNQEMQAKALSLMMRLEVLGHSLKRTAQELILILGSQEYSDALIFYKNNVKACEALIYKPNPEQKIDGLEVLFDQVAREHTQLHKRLEGKPNLVVEQTALLFKELYEFVGYACNNFKMQTNHDEYELHGRLGKLNERVHNVLRIMPASSQKLQSQEAARYLEQAKIRPLSHEDDFRNGMWLATTPYVGIYTEIQAEVAALKTTAKALGALLETIQHRIVQLIEAAPTSLAEPKSLKAELTRYNSLLDGIEYSIEEQRRALAERPLSQKIHAGLYYVAKQRATVKEVRMYIRQFRQIAIGKTCPTVVALGHLMHYLTQQKPQGAIHTFYAALRSACTLAKPDDTRPKTIYSVAYKVLSDTIACSGQNAVVLTEAESLVPNQLFAKTPLYSLHAATLPKTIKEYLMKGFIKCQYLLADACDPQFEVALHSIRTDPSYQAAYSQTMREDADFAALAKSNNTSQHDSTTLGMMHEVLYQLSKATNEDTQILHQRYYKITQYLFELGQTKATTKLQKSRLDWIEKTTKEPLKALKALLAVPNPPTRLYTLLRTSLFATQQSERLQASGLLDASPLPNDLEEYSPLFLRRALERLMSDGKVGAPHEKKLLHAFFEEYLSAQDIREYWHSEYSVATIELALAHFLEMAEQRLHTVVTRKRGSAYFDLWKALVVLRSEYTHENRLTLLQKAIRLFDAAAVDIDGPWEDLASHLSLARSLLNQMRIG